MGQDRVTRVRIEGMRAIAEIELPLDGLTVLIGENGSGKSTVVEAFELLHKVTRPGRYATDVVRYLHGDLPHLLRQGAEELVLSATIEGDGPRMEYSFSLGYVGTEVGVRRERLDVWANLNAREPLHAVDREAEQGQVFDVNERTLKHVSVPLDTLLATSFGLAAQPAQKRLVEALERIDVHPAFDTRPLWVQAGQQQQMGPRWPVLVEQAERVERLGANLANCFMALRNAGDETWNRVLERARLGLGDDFRDIRTPPTSRGNIGLEVWFSTLRDPIPVGALSEGQIAFLIFLAITELGTSRSVVVIDEPESHLHPSLLVRVVWMLEELSRTVPVVVATHSDRFLDALSDPARSVVLCELDENRRVVLRRPDPQVLERWLERYRGLGQLRAEGYEPHVFTPTPTPSGED